MPDLYRVLSIDGGGIRGIIPARVLIEVEAKLQQRSQNPDARIHDFFDFIAGTSTGGILTCIYLCPDPDRPGRPRFDASQALDLYFERGDEIFDIPVWHRIKSGLGTGLTDEKYPADGLEEALEDYLGDLKLAELLGPCLITSYDLKRRKTHFFKQHRAAEPNRNFLVRDVARATSAAPTFFECARVKSDANISFPLVDGGVFANNPTLCAYAEVRKQFDKRAADMAILSIGTGEHRKSYAYSEAKDWGLAGWAKPALEIMMSGVSETVHFQLDQIYDAVGAPDQYLRLDAKLPPSTTEMDNVDAENLAELREIGAEIAIQNDARLDAFIDLLVP